MSDLFVLSEAQMRRIERYFPPLHRIARVDGRRIVSNCDQERASLPRCAARSVASRVCSTRFSRALARIGGKPERIMIDATHLKAHRTAGSSLTKGLFPDVSGAPEAV